MTARDSSDRPVFLLGLGAQKTGTSWLHDYLQTHNQCATGFTKEYHILDGLYVPQMKFFRDRTAERFERVAARKSKAKKPDTPPHKEALTLRHRFYNDVSSYYDYFAGLATTNGARLATDITPTYMTLPPQALEQTVQEMQARGVDTRLIFIMRDPVDRLWSAVRMARRNARIKNPDHTFDLSEADSVRKRYTAPLEDIRGRYEQTLRTIEAAGLGDQTQFVFFEEMFNEDWLRGFCDFARIRYEPANFSKRVNASPGTDALPQELVRRIVHHHRDTYQAMAQRFGTDRLRRLWPNMELLQ